MNEPTTVDFETESIDSRPYYPPRPVGVALRRPGGKTEYLAWGHVDSVTGSKVGMGNNCSVGQAASVLRDIYRDPTPKLFHNGSFDLDVGEMHSGLKIPDDVEDTLFLAFLKNPHEPTIGLKPLCEKYLGMPPEEQEDLRDWILENVRQPNGKKITKKKNWGAYISKAPAEIVGPYAIGDVERTFKIWEKFRPEIIRRGMFDAYRREVNLIPITLEMERSGIRVDLPKLRKAEQVFQEMDNTVIKAIHKKLRIGSNDTDFNINSGAQLAAALIKADKLSARILTRTGKQSTKVSVLHDTCNDKELLDLLSIHSVADKYLTGFLKPWIAQAEITDGRVLPKFNQVRSRTNDGGGGTRTGRYSSSDPNLQTVTANVDESKNREVLMLMQKYLREYYDYDFIGLRDFFLPDEGCILTATDYNQQELRLLAHFEEGLLAEEYNKNPELDIHSFLQALIKQITGIEYPRKSIKILVFGIVYGMGVGKLAISIKESTRVAASIRDALFKAVPGIRTLMKELSRLEELDLPLRTYGGREYFCEEPIQWEGKTIHFGYKLLNYLIQGSAADVTKMGMLNVREQVPEARIAIQVHDELVCMIPHRKYGERIAKAMCDMPFCIPMLATTKYSTESWARVK